MLKPLNVSFGSYIKKSIEYFCNEDDENLTEPEHDKEVLYSELNTILEMVSGILSAYLFVRYLLRYLLYLVFIYGICCTWYCDRIFLNYVFCKLLRQRK